MTHLHDGNRLQKLAEVCQRGKGKFVVSAKILPGLCGQSHVKGKPKWQVRIVPPDRTIATNDLVTPLYFLLYSTVHTFSPGRFNSHPCLRFLSSISSGDNALRDKPSLRWAGHQPVCGRVRLDLVKAPPRCFDEEAFEDDDVLFEDTTLAPKNVRNSASASRFDKITDRRS